MDGDSIPKASKRLHDFAMPSFERPRIIGGMSKDWANKDPDCGYSYKNDLSLLQYLALPGDLSRGPLKVNFDLNVGREQWSFPTGDQYDEKMNILLLWILNNRTKFQAPGLPKLDQLNMDIVCSRGTLGKIMRSPYEQKSSWKIEVTKWKNTTYIHKCQSNDKVWMNTTDDSTKFIYWGFKFEQYLSAERPGLAPQTGRVVTDQEKFHSVYRWKLGQLSMVYKGEVDAYDSSEEVTSAEDLQANRFHEFKTSLELHPGNFATFHRFKLHQWWAQSFLVGIEDVICGWRNAHGIVTKIESIPVAEMEEMANRQLFNSYHCWKSNVDLNYLHQFLKFITGPDAGIEDDYKRVTRIEWTPSPRGDGGGSYSVTVKEDLPEEDRILPSWYVERIFN